MPVKVEKSNIVEDESGDKGPPCPTLDEVSEAVDLLQKLSLFGSQGTGSRGMGECKIFS